MFLKGQEMSFQMYEYFIVGGGGWDRFGLPPHPRQSWLHGYSLAT